MQEITLELTAQCPHDCQHCSSKSGPEELKRISPETAKRLMDEAVAHGAKRINFSGGEPLMHTFFWEIASEAAKRGFEIHVYTSGTVLRAGLKEPLSQRQAAKLKELGAVVAFNVLSADYRVHDMLTNSKGSFWRAAQSVIVCRESEVTVDVNFVPTKYNDNELWEMIPAATKVGVRQINVLRLVSQGRAIVSKLDMPKWDIEAFAHRALAGYTTKVNLGAPFNHAVPVRQQKSCSAIEKIVVTPEGILLPCEVFKGKRGDFEGPMTIQEALESRPFNRLRLWHEENPNRCPVHHADDWP